MSRSVELRCRCGAVHGRVSGVAPTTVNRVVCYCSDCQAFLHSMRRGDLLDAHGGSDIVQVAPAAVTFDSGQDRIRGLRLSTKGLYRWYASCCNTPLGNTAQPAVPFVGILVGAFALDADAPDAVFGPPAGAIYGQHAVGTPPAGSTKFNPRLMFRAVRHVLGWRLGGKAWPHPFFEHSTRAPRYPVTTLSSSERDLLRPLCGPHPTSASA